MAKIYIIRHGETIWNTQGKMQGWLDSPLTEKGKIQAQALKERFKDINVDYAYSSPLNRAFDTAKIALQDKDINIVKRDNLKEIKLDEIKGYTKPLKNDVNYNMYFNFWNHPNKYKSNNGESFKDVQERIVNEIKLLSKNKEGKNIFVFTHTIVIKSLICFIDNIDIEKFWEEPQIPQTSVTVINTDSKWEIQECASTSHI